MTAADHERWGDLIQRRCGVVFTPARHRLLEGALTQRQQALNLRTLDEYFVFVSFHPAGKAEWEQLQELLLNHETTFFRNQPAFVALTNEVLPALQAAGRKPIRLWSAGCSIGQEPYSLAMVAVAHGWAGAVQVLGTDLSPASLEYARRGWYKPHEVRGLLPEYERFVRPQTPPWLGVVPEVRSVVRYARGNLATDEGWPTERPDVIFCQNVLIYFPRELREQVAQRLVATLAPGGALFLGPVEGAGLALPGTRPVWHDGTMYHQRLD